MAEDAVQYNADAVRAALLAEFLEDLLVAQKRIDGEVVRRVIAVVGCRTEDRVQVQRRHAQRFQIRDLLADAVQRAAKEIKVGDVAGSVLLIVRELIPVVHIGAGRTLPTDRSFGRRCTLSRRDLSGCRRTNNATARLSGGLPLFIIRSPRKAVREDLIHQCVLVPRRRRERIVDRDLERRWLAVLVDAALAAQRLRVVPVADDPVAVICNKKVPQEARLLRYLYFGGEERGGLGHLDHSLSNAFAP